MSDLLDDIDKIIIEDPDNYCSIACEEKARFLATKRYQLSMEKNTRNNIVSLEDYKLYRNSNIS